MWLTMYRQYLKQRTYLLKLRSNKKILCALEAEKMSIYVVPLLCRKHTRLPRPMLLEVEWTYPLYPNSIWMFASAQCLLSEHLCALRYQAPKACPWWELGALCLSFLFGALLTTGLTQNREPDAHPLPLWMHAEMPAQSGALKELATLEWWKPFSKGISGRSGFRDINDCVELGWIQNNTGLQQVRFSKASHPQLAFLKCPAELVNSRSSWQGKRQQFNAVKPCHFGKPALNTSSISDFCGPCLLGNSSIF